MTHFLYLNYPSFIHPEIFPGVPFLGLIRWYGLMYIFAFGTAFLVLKKLLKEGALDSAEYKTTEDDIFSFISCGIIFLLIGARIFSTLIYDTSGIYLKKAISFYGKENFSCKVIEFCETRKEMLEREKFWISYYKDVINENYYNLQDGGQGGHCEYYVQPVTQKQLDALEYGRHLPASDKLKSKLSEIRTNCVVSDETRLKLSIAQTGKMASEETKKKLSLIRTGKKLPSRTDIQKEHYKESSSDRVHIHKGTINKNPKKFELQSYLDEGWEIGYCYKAKSSTTKG